MLFYFFEFKLSSHQLNISGRSLLSLYKSPYKRFKGHFIIKVKEHIGMRQKLNASYVMRTPRTKKKKIIKLQRKGKTALAKRSTTAN